MANPSTVYFKRGKQAQYDALPVKNENTLYFISDTQRIYKGDVLYGFGTPTYTGTIDADTSDADALASKLIDGKTSYVNDAKITGTMPDSTGNGTTDGATDNHA